MNHGFVRLAASVAMVFLVVLSVTAVTGSPSGSARALLVAGTIILGLVGIFSLGAEWRASARDRAERASRDGALADRVRSLEETISAREAMLASMHEGIVLFGADRRVIYANPAARDLLGRRLTESSEVTPLLLREAIQQVREGSGTGRVEFEITGRTVDALVLRAEPPGTTLVVARDITAAMRTDKLRRDFVANASHELKTPVASILALATTLGQATDDAAALQRFLDHLETEAARLSRLVADLLDLSRLESGFPETGSVRLDEVVRYEVAKLRGRAEGAGLRLVVEELEPTLVSGSESDLGIMIHNLLDNAIRYTPVGGEVRLVVQRVDNVAQMRVEDTGIGIPSADLDRVFERFYRVDTGRSRETGGTGLGLSIVRHVVEAHQGTVKLRSILGAGSNFVVELPLADGQ